MFATVINFIDDVAEFDYVAAGEKALNLMITIVAVIVGVTQYAYTALMLWWEENDESVISICQTAGESIKAFALGCYNAGKQFRPVANYYVAMVADSAYRKAIAM